MNRVRQTVVAAALALAVAGMAVFAASACAQEPAAIPCEIQAAARPECEEFFGAKIRADFDARGFSPMDITDVELARMVNQLCLDGEVNERLLERVRHLVAIADAHKQPYCG